MIIAVTGHVFATDRDAAHRAGWDFFFPKSLDLTTFADFVDGLLHPSGRASRPRRVSL
jgi:hypothetical protein